MGEHETVQIKLARRTESERKAYLEGYNAGKNCLEKRSLTGGWTTELRKELFQCSDDLRRLVLSICVEASNLRLNHKKSDTSEVEK